MSDPIADLLIRIKNGYMARKSQVGAPWSKILEKIAQILVAHGYLDGYEVQKDKFKTLVLTLKYTEGGPGLTNVNRVSKPGVRHYVKAANIRPVLGDLGIAIISTPEGLMTNKEAKKKRLGGEIVCEIW